MPYLLCENPTHEEITGKSGRGFEHYSRGRPPKYCPECREVVKPPAAPKAPVKPGVAEEDVRQWAAEATIDYLETMLDFDDLDTRVEKVKNEIQDKVNLDFTGKIDDLAANAEMEFARVRLEVDKYIDRIVEERVPKITVIRRDSKDIKLPHTSHELLPLVIQLLNRKHVFLVGPAGSGKSTIVVQAAKLLNTKFGSISFGPTTPTSKLFGFIDANGNFNITPFYEVYRCTCGSGDDEPCADDCGGIMLGDEIDNGHPGLVAELNQALSNDYCAFACGMVKKSKNFRFCATGNTYGTGPDRKFVGRNMLDKATLNRFALKTIGYDTAMEYNLAMSKAETSRDEWLIRQWIDYCQHVRGNISERNIDIIVSPRQTIDGAQFLVDGLPWDEVAQVMIWEGVSLDVRRSIDVEVDLTPPQYEPLPSGDDDDDIPDEGDPFEPRQGW